MADNTVGGTQFAWVNDSGTTITGNLTVLSTSSTFSDDYQDTAGATISGNILVNLGGGANDADFLGTVGGSTVEYVGGGGVDDVSYDMPGGPVDVTITLGDGVNIGGNTYISLGENISLFAAQNVNLTGGFFSGGFVSVLGGQSFAGNSVVTDSTTTIGQSFIIDFSANSSGNFAVIDGTYGGNFGLFRGGSGNDLVSMDDVAGDMDFFLQLGAGADTLNLGDGTLVNYLFVSFGDGIDTFNDEFFGFYPFATAFWQLP